MSKLRGYTEHEEALVLSLLGDGKWHTAADILSRCHVPARAVRLMGEISCLLISSNDGYKRRDKATPSEDRAYINSLRSRAKRITDHADRLEFGHKIP